MLLVNLITGRISLIIKVDPTRVVTHCRVSGQVPKTCSNRSRLSILFNQTQIKNLLISRTKVTRTKVAPVSFQLIVIEVVVLMRVK
jgi:hypothetical protein